MAEDIIIREEDIGLLKRQCGALQDISEILQDVLANYNKINRGNIPGEVKKIQINIEEIIKRAEEKKG